MTDTELLDALEREIKRRPLTLWDGIGTFPELPLGLSLLGGKRTLRKAIQECLVPKGVPCKK